MHKNPKTRTLVHARMHEKMRVLFFAIQRCQYCSAQRWKEFDLIRPDSVWCRRALQLETGNVEALVGLARISWRDATQRDEHTARELLGQALSSKEMQSERVHRDVIFLYADVMGEGSLGPPGELSVRGMITLLQAVSSVPPP